MPVMLNDYLREKYGCKVYKIALNANVTCPNRDGTIGDRGCIFCSQGGSGEFAPDKNIPIKEQIEIAKKRVSSKIKSGKYIAYFQSFTNTYGSIEYLRKIYYQAIRDDDIVGISIATRPDCLEKEVIILLDEVNRIKPVWIELGLQTIHEKSIEYIRRGYDMNCFDEAIEKLREINVGIIVHVILGLPGETEEDTIETIRYVSNNKIDGIKLQMLHILKGTDLAEEYWAGKVKVFEPEEYVELVKKCIKLLPEKMVIHRVTGDGPKNLLIAPKWSGDKKRVLNLLAFLRQN